MIPWGFTVPKHGNILTYGSQRGTTAAPQHFYNRFIDLSPPAIYNKGGK